MGAIYVGTNKIKKIFHGTTAIKKVYSGSTLIWSSEPSVNSSIPNLTTIKGEASSTSIGNYALFGGGYVGYRSDSYDLSVETFNTSLVKGTAPNLNSSSNRSRYGIGTASTSSHTIFYSGHTYRSTGTGWSSSAYSDAYNSSLVQSSAGINTYGGYICGGSVGTNAVFVGGLDANDVGIENIVSINSSLVSSVIYTGDYAWYNRRSANVGNYCIWAGGEGGGLGYRDYTVCYNSSLTRMSVVNLAIARGSHMAGSTPSYAIFAGGVTSKANNYYSATTETFNSSLVRGVGPNLSSTLFDGAGGKNGDYAIFASVTSSDWYNMVVNTISDSLVLMNLGAFPYNNTDGWRAKYWSAANAGDNTIIGGGNNTTSTFCIN